MSGGMNAYFGAVRSAISIALRNVSSIRVCQPRPVARKRARTSTESRILIGTFLSTKGGRPRRRCISISSGMMSQAGRARAKSSSLQIGLSASLSAAAVIPASEGVLIKSPPGCLAFGRAGMTFTLPFICLSEADHTDCPALPDRKDQHVKTRTNKSVRNIANFAVVVPRILEDQRSGPVKMLGLHEIDAVLGQVSKPLRFIPSQHPESMPTGASGVNISVGTINRCAVRLYNIREDLP